MLPCRTDGQITYSRCERCGFPTCEHCLRDQEGAQMCPSCFADANRHITRQNFHIDVYAHGRDLYDLRYIAGCYNVEMIAVEAIDIHTFTSGNFAEIMKQDCVRFTLSVPAPDKPAAHKIANTISSDLLFAIEMEKDLQETEFNPEKVAHEYSDMVFGKQFRVSRIRALENAARNQGYLFKLNPDGITYSCVPDHVDLTLEEKK